jgi:hypothetical protein
LNEDLRDGERRTVRVCGPVDAASMYFAEGLTLVGEDTAADHVICFVRAEFQRIPEGAKIYHTIGREGVALTKIWQTREFQVKSRAGG